MRTEEQEAPSRANSAESRGPVTPEGKAISARNAFLHGLYSRDRLTLTTEQTEQFQHFTGEFILHYLPNNVVERQIVHEMALVQWRRMRAEMIEAVVIDNRMDRMAAEVENDYQGASPGTRAALAYQKLHEESPAPQDLGREIARLSRQFLNLERALRQIRTAENSASKKM